MAEGINIVTPERRELSTKKTAPQWVLSSQSMVAGLISGASFNKLFYKHIWVWGE